jgi:hypothetical protein
MLEELSEDSQIRTKVAEWRKQFTGDSAMEQEVMSGSGLKAIPVWDKHNMFVTLSSTEALDIIEHFVSSKTNMLKLTNPGEAMRTINGMVDGDDVKTELMAYLLRRMGVGTQLPVGERTVASISEHVSQIGLDESGPGKKAVMEEFKILAKIMSPDIPEDRKKALLDGMGKRQDMSGFSKTSLAGA